MSAFDELTLGEVEELTTTALKGVSMADADPLMISGGVMWLTQRRDDPGLSWEAFRDKVKMGDIKAFTAQMQAEAEAEAVDPTVVQSEPLN